MSYAPVASCCLLIAIYRPTESTLFSDALRESGTMWSCFHVVAYWPVLRKNWSTAYQIVIRCLSVFHNSYSNRGELVTGNVLNLRCRTFIIQSLSASLWWWLIWLMIHFRWNTWLDKLVWNSVIVLNTERFIVFISGKPRRYEKSAVSSFKLLIIEKPLLHLK